MPWIRTIGPGKPEALRPGIPELAEAKRISKASLHLVALPFRKRGTAPDVQGPVSGTERCFFGDLHRHSDFSVCTPNKDGSLSDHYRWARDLGHYDFYALTDHAEHLGANAWAQILAAADAFDRPGSFVALYGLEFTNTIGADGEFSPQDVCLFIADRGVAWRIWYDVRHGLSGDRFLQVLRLPEIRGKICLVRHFHGGEGKGLDMSEPCNRLLAGAGPDLEPALEIVQVSGSCAHIVMEVLASGQRKGVIGGTDHARPRPDLAHFTGTTGVWADELSRSSVMSTLFRRRSFATNGPRMVVDFECAGALMGGETDADDTVGLRGFVQGTTRLKSVTVHRDTTPWQQIDVQDSRCEFRLEDRPAAGSHFYWLHAVQEPDGGERFDGELWSSSVWVKVGEV